MKFKSQLLCFLIIVVASSSITAQRTIPPGSSIVAKADGASTWTSPSGEFAFGFMQVPGGGFLLAIWFDRLPGKTIVWSANRNNPAPSGSTLQFSQQGRLELIDPRNRQIWGVTQLGTVSYAAMLDTGNFVLAADNSSAPLWQSFNQPTDTLLPGQILRGDRVLFSSFSETNHSEGRFKFIINGDTLGLHTRNFPWDNTVFPYWLWPGSQFVFNQSGNVYRADADGSVVNATFDGGAAPVEDFLQRLTLDYDGVLRQYVYPKSANRTGGRPMAWSVQDFIPPNVCFGLNVGGNGGGICGYNSLCQFGAHTGGRTVCRCPPGYSPIDPADRFSGCRPDFALQSCDPESNDGDLFEFTEYLNTNWPYADYSSYRPTDEDACRRDCLSDCFCAVMIYTGGTCWKKPLPFINGRSDSRMLEKALVKVRKNATAAVATPPPLRKINRLSTAFIVTGSALMGTSMILLSISLFLLFGARKSDKVGEEARLLPHPAGISAIRGFSFKELQEATDGFKEELGRGACSTVYKGILKLECVEKVVAVKKLHRVAKEADIEFIAEVSSISRTNHRNLVQLLGYCDEGENRILVYEYMTNGSLANLLFEQPQRPNWYTRVQIAFAIARGICYLHEECSAPIIHCDIKPQNVLLDETFAPKIADFGLAKLLKPDQTRTTTGIRGTRGYVAPEWFRNMAITAKVDVYSFGVLLLELICCRRNYEPKLEGDGGFVLTDWAYDCYVEGDLDPLVEGDEEAKSDMKMLGIFVKTAIWCIQEDPTMRPQMRRVLHMLEGSIQVPSPPDPATFIN